MTTYSKANRNSVATYLDIDGHSYWQKPPEIKSIDDFDLIDIDQLRVEFMRVSPSYALRCQLALSRQTDEIKSKRIFDLYQRASETAKFRGLDSLFSSDRNRLQFEKFQKTYARIDHTYQEYGNVLIPYSDWYLKTGRKVFDNWTNRRDVKFFGTFNYQTSDGDLDNKQIRKNITKYLDEMADTKDWPPTMLLSIPLDLPKSVALKNLKILLNAHYDFVVPIKNQTYRKKKLIEGERERPDALSRRLKMLICKAFYPDAQLWKLGLMAGVSKAHMIRFYDASTSTEEFRNLRPQLAALANRAIRTGQYIAEHASFDLFPSHKKVVTPFYDWELIKQRILAAHPNLKIRLPK